MNIDGQYVVTAIEVKSAAMSGDIVLLSLTFVAARAKLLPGSLSTEHTVCPSDDAAFGSEKDTPALFNVFRKASVVGSAWAAGAEIALAIVKAAAYSRTRCDVPSFVRVEAFIVSPRDEWMVGPQH
ncbi:hypothetical protein A5752_22615 [Mycobacterium sp. 852002-51961_SCH5331710]|nr:hypothetical protein A5752_22615 [Mycobacterium sp. 852002-51961_SCH5331710]